MKNKKILLTFFGLYIFLRFLPDNSVNLLQEEGEIKCVTAFLTEYTQDERDIFLGLDYWDARRFQHLISNKNVTFIPVTPDLEYLSWMAKKENSAAKINYAYLDPNLNYNFTTKSVLVLKNKCGQKQFYRVEGR
jgi:hypothetical protein